MVGVNKFLEENRKLTKMLIFLNRSNFSNINRRGNKKSWLTTSCLKPGATMLPKAGIIHSPVFTGSVSNTTLKNFTRNLSICARFSIRGKPAEHQYRILGHQETGRPVKSARTLVAPANNEQTVAESAAILICSTGDVE